MKTLLSTLAASLCFTFSLSAQDDIRCATREYMDQQIQKDPSLNKRLQEIETNLQLTINSNKFLKTGASVITIPVVVHVVYNATAENLSDAQVKSQIAVLNEDYRLLNADKKNTPSVFSSVAADAQIEFCLAKIDPQGNPTTGIIRKQTTMTSFALSDNGVKYTSMGGDDAWDATKYLNIWTCNLSGGILGYAQIPGLAAATDGVAIKYYAFGYGGSAKKRFDKGRTATHEIGHWLGLIHIWGDANCGDDQVADTPPQQTYNVGCPYFPKISCAAGSDGDMFMNFMDYVDDSCMNIFTSGQVTRMMGTLNGTRSTFKTATACTGPTSVQTAKLTGNLSADIFPNPGTGLFNCKVEGLAASNCEIKITSLIGEFIAEEKESNNGSFILNLSQHSNGIYVVRIADGKSVLYKKIIVSK